LSPEVLLVPDDAGFVRVTCPPEVSLRWLLAAIDQVRAATERARGLRILVDLSAVASPPGRTEQLLVGEHVARQLAHVEKLASLVAPGTRSGLSEAVARRLRLNLRVFTSQAEAIGWLCE
jgi:hypothetical protein